MGMVAKRQCVCRRAGVGVSAVVLCVTCLSAARRGRRRRPERVLQARGAVFGFSLGGRFFLQEEGTGEGEGKKHTTHTHTQGGTSGPGGKEGREEKATQCRRRSGTHTLPWAGGRGRRHGLRFKADGPLSLFLSSNRSSSNFPPPPCKRARESHRRGVWRRGSAGVARGRVLAARNKHRGEGGHSDVCRTAVRSGRREKARAGRMPCRYSKAERREDGRRRAGDGGV